jgi:hypothetical protein
MASTPAQPKLSKANQKKSAPRQPKSQQLLDFSVDPVLATQEALSFANWLAGKIHFEENRDAVPQFDARRHFCAAIGITCGEKLLNPDRFAFELSLGGKYFPDIAVGDSKTKSLVLIELEGAEPSQIFLQTKPGEQYPDYSAAFRQGFFQLLDWVHALKDASPANRTDWFTFDPISVRTVLVVGRDAELGANGSTQGTRRLETLASSFSNGKNELFIYTYDQLSSLVSARLHAPL